MWPSPLCDVFYSGAVITFFSGFPVPLLLQQRHSGATPKIPDWDHYLTHAIFPAMHPHQACLHVSRNQTCPGPHFNVADQLQVKRNHGQGIALVFEASVVSIVGP